MRNRQQKTSGRPASRRGIAARVNRAIDAAVQRALALVAHRLNGIVEAVDRVDGATGRGLAIATAMAQLTGFEVRDQQVIVTTGVPASPALPRLPMPDLAAAARVAFALPATGAPRLHRISGPSHALN